MSFVVALVLACVAQVVPDLDPRVKTAMALLDRGDRAGARQALEALGPASLQDGVLQVTIAYELVRREEYAVAEPFARRGAALLPQHAHPAKVFGLSLLFSDRAEEAERIFRAAVDRFRGTIDEPDLVFNLAMSCALQNKRLEAGDWFAKAIALKPKDALFRFSAAENDRNLQRYAAAEEGFRLAMTLEPRHADAGWKLAVTLAVQQRDAEAEPLFKSAIAPGSTLPPASQRSAAYQYGVFLFERGRAEEAEPLLTAVTKAKPDDRMAWNYLARTLRSLGKKEQSAAALRQYQQLQKQADLTETRYLLGLIRERLSADSIPDGKRVPERR